MKTVSLALFACSLVACATEAKAPVDPQVIEAIDVEGKDDSLNSPTFKGTVAMGDVVEGRVTKTRAYHAYDYTYAGQSGLVRLDVKSTVGDDLALIAYRRTGNRWTLVDWNDDCGDGSLNACLAMPATAGRYRLVITTFDALIGYPRAANYTFSVSCKDGDCLSRACGGLLGLQCGEGQYCNYEPEAICGAADATGTCADLPEICTEEYAPVCACNGQTYGNACWAAAAGTSVVSQGECPAVACGGRAGDTCGADEYCRFELSEVCGRADAEGTCEKRPDACIALYDPVCGCDNQTYSNSCAAASAGVGVLADGACTEQP